MTPGLLSSRLQQGAPGKMPVAPYFCAASQEDSGSVRCRSRGSSL
jgi:hypothetical protein